MKDLQEIIRRRLIEPNRLLELFGAIEDQLYKYPAINAASFRRKVEHVVKQVKPESDPS